MSSRSSFSYSKPSLDVSFSVDGLNLDPDYVFGPDQDLFHHHVFRGEDTRASFTSHLSASLQSAGINLFKDGQTADFVEFVVIHSRVWVPLLILLSWMNFMVILWCSKFRELFLWVLLHVNLLRFLMFFSILLSWIYFSGLVALTVLRMLVIFSFMFVFLDFCICLYNFCVCSCVVCSISWCSISFSVIYNKIGRNFEGTSFLANIL